MTLASLLVPWLLAIQQQPSSSADTVVTLARTGTDSSLVAAVHHSSDVAREALSRVVALSVSGASDESRNEALRIALRIAGAYAVAWSDSFFVRQLVIFERWSPAQRAAKLAADSLRRAGNEALGQRGVSAAMRLWRASDRRCAALGDSAGRAAALGNIGAGFLLAGRLDSATSYLQRSRDVAERVGDVRTTANAIGTLASVRKDVGDLEGARRLYTVALDMRNRSGDGRGEAADHNNLGLIAQSLGELAEAQRFFETALSINRRHDRPATAAINLTNLANLASLNADYQRSASLYAEALAIHVRGGDRVESALVLRNLGLLASRRGDYTAATEALSEAVTILRETGPESDEVGARADLAAARAAMGDLQGALIELRHAERFARESEVTPSAIAGLAMARADIALRLNTPADAEREYRRAAELYLRAGDRAGQASARVGRGVLLLLREDWPSASTVLDLAARGQTAAGDRHGAATTSLLIGYAQQRRGDTVTARQTLTVAHRALRAMGDSAGAAAALGALGALEADRGRSLAAEALYRRGIEQLGSRPARDVAAQLRAGLGHALWARGANTEAALTFRTAIAESERVSSGLRSEDERAAFLLDKWDVYGALAIVEHELGRHADAFEVSENMRARQMLDLLGRGRLSTATPDSALQVREQDMRRRISELTRALTAQSDAGTRRGPPLSPRGADVLREALNGEQKAYAALLLEIREHSPEYGQVVGSATVPWRSVAARLAPDQLILEYLLTDSASIVFAVTADTVITIDLGATRREIATLVEFARGALARVERSPTRELWRVPLRRLYQELLAPVEDAGLLRGKRRLLIAPHAELHYLSFAALVARDAADRFLVERYDITYIPSASVWVRMGERPRPPASNGVLALAPQPVTLPASVKEVEAIRRVYGDRATILVGDGASESAFRKAAPRHGILHLATVGVLNKHNPLFSFVGMASGAGDDGRLEVHEVFGLSLDARLLVLSACQTALGSGALEDLPMGDDWVGLVRAFLFAGAANVLATLWPVDDAATAQLMGEFYRVLESGGSESAATAAAQRSMLRDPRTAHPFFWAGFALVGGS